MNGPPGSAGGERARRIARALGDKDVQLVHRARRRSSDLARFLAAGRPGRNALLYAMDLAVLPVAAGTFGSFSSPFILDTGDSPAEFLRLVSAGRAHVAAARLMERVAYGCADEVVVRGAHHQTQLQERGIENVTVIPDGVDLDVFRPVDDRDLRRRLGLDGAFTVGIQANFTWFERLGGGVGWELVHAMAARPDLPIKAVLIGDGPGLAPLRALAHDLGVGHRVLEMGRVPYADLPRYLGLCDVCLLTLTDDPASWVRTTGKLPGYLASGRYILSTRVGTAASLLPEEMLLEYSGAWDLSYPERLGDRLAEVFADPDRGEKGLALIGLADQFDYDLIARRAVDVIHDTARGMGIEQRF